ncbi:MAG: fibronectin type III domain-containing protein [Chloroflexi bacterium]|nr:fibronectin type III domain-containing protein [Chloroflexota bacterium]
MTGRLRADLFYRLISIVLVLVNSLALVTVLGLTSAPGAAAADPIPVVEWSNIFSRSGPDAAYSVCQTSDGGYIMVGETYAYVDADADVWLIKADADGNESWNRGFGGGGEDIGRSVQQTADGGYIIAGKTWSFDDEMVTGAWLIKTDPDGNMSWDRTFGCPYSGGGPFLDADAYSVQQTTDGGYVMAGWALSAIDGQRDALLIKTDAEGNESWTRTFGSHFREEGYSVQQTTDGGYIIAGWASDAWLIKTDAEGNESWTRAFGGANWDNLSSVQQTGDGGYIMVGYTCSYGAGDADVWLIKTDPEGNESWSKTLGGPESDGPGCVQQTSDGGYIVAGITDSCGDIQGDAWLVKVSSESDMTPPLTPVVTDDGATTSNNTQLHASWTSSDAESGIAEYQYAIGTSAGGTDVVSWTSTGTATEITKTGLSLGTGTKYYVSVKAKNGAGLWSEVGASDGIVCDNTPPTTPVVTDAGDYTSSNTQLHATWSSSDNESGIAEYQYAIGTSAGGTDVVSWTSVGTNTQVTKTGLSLNWGSTYYFAVKAKNGAGTWSSVGNSNGITVSDGTAPSTPVVTDDGATTSNNTQLHATWSSSDNESGIAEYQYAIGTSAGGTDVVSWTSTGTTGGVTHTGLNLAAGTKYFICVKAKDGAGLWSETGISDGITVAAEGVAVEDIPPAGGTVQTADGKITAEFPANAAAGELTVTIKDIEPPSDTSTSQGFKAGNTYFVIEITDASGNPVVTLSQPITITVKYSVEDVAAAGGDPNNLVLAYYDETAGEWKPLDTTVNTSDKTLSATTNHFSTWAVLAKSPSEGLAAWIWIVIGIGAALGAGIVAYIVRRRLIQKV